MSAAHSIQAITFDAGGTLIEPFPSVGHVYAEVALEHGLADFPVDWLNERFARVWRNKTNFNYSPSAWRELVAQTFFDSAEATLPRGFFETLYERFAEPPAWRVFDDVGLALNLLQQKGVRMGLISNWDERLEPLLRKLGLDRYFEVITISCRCGAQKPAKEIFEITWRQLGIDSRELLHIGDSCEEDVRGAQEAGARSLWLNRRSGARQTDQIRSLGELSARLGFSESLN